jgi:hypothetical protein
MVELLEDRLTPANVSASISGSTLFLTKTGGGSNTLIITPATAGQLTVTTTPGNTINGTLTTITTPVPITAVVVGLRTGNDLLVFDGTGLNGPINLSGRLTINGGSGDKIIEVTNTNIGGNVSIDLSGAGSENTTFTDVNVGGAASISHLGTGNTSVTITTSGSPMPDEFFNWGSLSITNGIGSDVNLISDTDFAGDVTIINGPGATGFTGQTGGSSTNISATNDENLTTISGNLFISTASGQSDSELYDYNVVGNVTIDTGAGVAGQLVPSFVGVENIQSFPGSGTPVIGGNVTIQSTTVSSVLPGLIIDFGTGIVPVNLPLVIEGNLNISVNGTGSVGIDLNDLSVPDGTTSVTLGPLTSDCSVSVQGSTVTSVYNSFFLISKAGGFNTFSIQDQAGETDFDGPVAVRLGSGNDTLNLGGDVNNPTGVPGAVAKFFRRSAFNGGSGTNVLFGGLASPDVFFKRPPKIVNFP